MALRANAKLDLIKGIPLFEHCSKKDLQHIAGIADELDLRAGKVLIREGERGREFFVLVSGEAEVRRKGRKVATVGPGDFVGEMALLSKAPRNATVTTLTPVDVLVITDRAFVDLLDKTPDLWHKVARDTRRAARRQRARQPPLERSWRPSNARVREARAGTELRRAHRPPRAPARAMTHVMWVDADDDHVLINTEVHRAKFEAVERDPRVTVMIWDRDDPYTVRRGARPGRGDAERGPEARGPHRRVWPGSTSAATTTPPASSPERVILRIAPDVQRLR